MCDESFTSVNNHLNLCLDDIVDCTKQLVLAESPSTDPESQSAVFEIISDNLESVGFNVKHIPGKHSGGQIFATPPGCKNGDWKKGQLLLGHSDTVWPVGTLKEIPFRIEKEIITGPGIYDMKAGIAQMLHALKALYSAGFEPELPPVIFISSDEELESSDSKNLIQKISANMERVFVIEPSYGSEGLVKTSRKSVAQYEIEITGKAAHAGLEPENGASAILELAHVVKSLHDLNDFEEGISVNVGLVKGGLRPNVVAPTSKATVDVRSRTLKNALEVEAKILGLQPVLPDVKLDISGGIERPPMEKTSRNKDLWDTAKNIGDKLGIGLKDCASGGVSDGNFTSLHTATLDGLGAVGGGAHSFDEFIYKDKLLERTVLLSHLLMAPC